MQAKIVCRFREKYLKVGYVFPEVLFSISSWTKYLKISYLLQQKNT